MGVDTAAPFTPFTYPPLPLGQDAIRLLRIDPGDFHEPLIATLTPVAFEYKPKYVALSYTWQDPYADHSHLPTSAPEANRSDSRLDLDIPLPKGLPNLGSKNLEGEPLAYLTLNGHPHPLNHNLHLALLHLRSLTEALTIWVDAICISQSDTNERNAQVSLMSLIFLRAMKVVSWLGTNNYGNETGIFRRMSIEWKAGRTQLLAKSLAEGVNIRRSVEPDRQTVARIAESAYWTRLWIIQELCLPQSLVFVYGPKLWPYEDFRQCAALKSLTSLSLRDGSAPSHVSSLGLQTMLQLFDTRDSKHTHSATLETLMKKFSTSQCSELRDKVYGLLGLANNVNPMARNPTLANPNSKDLASPSNHNHGLAEPQGRPGLLEIDYSRSFYDIWTDVVLVLTPTKTHGGQPFGDFLEEVSGFYDMRIFEQDKRNLSVVRNAAVIQEALNQMVEKDVELLQSPEVLLSPSCPHLQPFAENL